MFEDLNEILSIPSVKGCSEPGAPFGKDIRKALDWFLSKSKEYGFRTEDMDGYCGWAEYGEGEESVGILCHLDVVPAGEGWTFPPYKLTVENGVLYGRGVVDDKGPTVACMRALKKIKDEGIRLKKRVRIIAGCDEENGSGCMKHYVKHGEIPSMSIVPDSEFPIINSEKGILHAELTIPKDDFVKANLILSGGHTMNVIPNIAAMTIKKGSPLFNSIAKSGKANEDLLSLPSVAAMIKNNGYGANDFSVKSSDEGLTVTATGVAGHASMPHLADNAIWKLFVFLDAFKTEINSEVVSAIREYFCSKDALNNLGIYKCDKESGEQTMSFDILKDNGDNLTLSLDMRCPISASKDEIISVITSRMPKGSKIKELGFAPNLYISEDNILVKKLLEVYKRCTGSESYCVKSGGGTYARKLPNAVAFGPAFPGEKTNIHNIDEFMTIEQFNKSAEIYKEAIISLAERA